MEYNKTIICDICKKTITLPEARIEWSNAENSSQMHICHHDCSYGIRKGISNLADMILDQDRDNFSADDVYEKLQAIPDDHGSLYRPECDRIIKLLFAKYR